MASETNRQYCLARVRDYDYDRYFAAALADSDTRQGLLALYAFNLEIASVRELVSEPTIGLMRLQWWRDTVDGIYEGTVRSHAVADELAWAIRRYDLPREEFDRMIDAREFDVDDGPPEDFGALNRYADETAGSLAVLAARLCGSGESPDAARSTGRIWALAGLLRAVPFHASTGKVFLPRDVLRREGVRLEAIVDSGRRSGVERAVAALIPEIRRMIPETRDALRALPRNVRPAVAYLPVADLYLSRLAGAGGDVFGDRREPGLLRRQMTMAAAHFAGRF